MTPRSLQTLHFVACASLFATSLSAQSIDAVWGAGTVARSGAVIADTIDPWSAAMNPALAASTRGSMFCVAAEVLASPPEPSRVALLATVPFAPFTLICAFASNGLSQYRESMWTLGAASRVSPAITAGARINYHSLSIERYGASGAITLDCGARMALAPEWAFAASIDNLLGPSIGALGGELRRTVRLGMLVIPTPLVTMTVDAVARPDELGVFCIGVHVQAHEHLAITGGMNTLPSSLSIGAMLNVGSLAICYGYRVRPELGPFHAVSAGMAL